MERSTPWTPDSGEMAPDYTFVTIFVLMFVEQSSGQLFVAEPTETGQFAHSLLDGQIARALVSRYNAPTVRTGGRLVPQTSCLFVRQKNSSRNWVITKT